MELADSPAWGVLACLGSISEMPGGAANVFEMIDLDLGYAPPFSPVWDPVLVAARVASRT